MGNSLGAKKKAKVIMIDGRTFKLKTPARTLDIVKDYPGHVLLESNTVKRCGVRAKPLDADQEIKPGKIYFLIELPKFLEERVMRRVKSCVHMSAKDRLDSLMLSRRSASDFSVARQQTSYYASDSSGPSLAPVQVKMKLLKSRMDKLVRESKDKSEIAQKIVNLYIKNCGEIELKADESDAGSSLSSQQEVVQWITRVGGNGIR
ncbi:uncharacterized protein At1g66480-like [Apium graveolens]|uniref:uncharacterized protein At1g66480-like n=1 Tax=Apium graveolens TaxID=4045 RepID=UPI003D7AEB22